MRTRSGRAHALPRYFALAVRALVLGGFAVASSACSGSEPANEHEAPLGNAPGCEGRGESIALGMTKSSDDGALAVELDAATPLPPVQGENSWTVAVSRDDQPVVDEGDADSQVIANVYMAEHDHNIRKRGVMTAPGVFEFASFPITMNGYWQITIQAQSDADPDDRADAVFEFCVQN